ncbi:MAG: family 20 glycosylhydrolase [Clostridia bacterium]|nr:family 20 glycosylhydrolase [Clostridia bacterium]
MRVFPKIKDENFNGEEFVFGKILTLTLSKKFYIKSQANLFAELYKNFTAGIGVLKIAVIDSDEKTAVLTSKAYATLPVVDVETDDYALKVDERKAELHFQDEKSLAHAFCTLLALIEVRNTVKGKETFTLPQGVARDKPIGDFRAIHLCVFSYTTMDYLQKYVRLAGFMKLSYVVLEFWKTYPFACFKAGVDKGAFSKRELMKLCEVAKALGVEIIPMINTLGHASWGSRKSGEHLALYNNPKLADLYDTIGWNWNVRNPRVLALQKQMIDELIQTFDGCAYVHLGCDEAFGFGVDRIFQGDKKPTEYMCEHINALARYVKSKGKTSLIWGDMLLPRKPEWVEHKTECHALSEESAQILINGLDKDIVLVDWQYTITYDDIPTAKYLSEQGFKVIMAPWRETKPRIACQANVEKYGYLGLMLTTWDEKALNRIYAEGATLAWNGAEEMQKHFATYGGTAAITVINYYIRNVYKPKKLKFEDSGAYKANL